MGSRGIRGENSSTGDDRLATSLNRAIASKSTHSRISHGADDPQMANQNIQIRNHQICFSYFSIHPHGMQLHWNTTFMH